MFHWYFDFVCSFQCVCGRCDLKAPAEGSVTPCKCFAGKKRGARKNLRVFVECEMCLKEGANSDPEKKSAKKKIKQKQKQTVSHNATNKS